MLRPFAGGLSYDFIPGPSIRTVEGTRIKAVVRSKWTSEKVGHLADQIRVRLRVTYQGENRGGEVES